jgi:hypothetical protein
MVLFTPVFLKIGGAILKNGAKKAPHCDWSAETYPVLRRANVLPVIIRCIVRLCAGGIGLLVGVGRFAHHAVGKHTKDETLIFHNRPYAVFIFTLVIHDLTSFCVYIWKMAQPQNEVKPLIFTY